MTNFLRYRAEIGARARSRPDRGGSPEGPAPQARGCLQVEFLVEQGLTGLWPGVSIAFHVHVGGGGSNREISRIFNYTPVLCVFGETSAVRV